MVTMMSLRSCLRRISSSILIGAGLEAGMEVEMGPGLAMAMMGEEVVKVEKEVVEEGCRHCSV